LGAHTGTPLQKLINPINIGVGEDRVGGLPLVGNPSSHTTEHTAPYTAVR